MFDTALRRLTSLVVLAALSVCLASTAALGKPTYAERMEIGNLLFFNGDVDRAIRAFETAAELNPHAFEPYLNLLNLYVQKGDAESQAKAAVACQEVLKRKPNNKDVHFILANLLRNQASSELDPEKSRAKLEQAVKEVEEALAYGASKALCHYTLGTILLQKGDIDRALSEVSEALSDQPLFADAHFVHAVLLFKKLSAAKSPGETVDLTSASLKQDIQKVLDELTLAAKQKGKNAEALNTKAEIEVATGDLSEAIKDFKQATKDDPNYFQGWSGLGVVETQLATREADGDKQRALIDEAKEAFEKARALKPDDKNVSYALALIFEKLGKTDEALAEFQKDLFLETDPSTKAAIQLHVQQLQQQQLLKVQAPGTSDGGVNPNTIPGIGSSMFTSGALSIPFKDLIKIEEQDNGKKKK